MSQAPHIINIVSFTNFSLVQFGGAIRDMDVVQNLTGHNYEPFYLNEGQEESLQTLNFKEIIAFQSRAKPSKEARVFDRMFIRDEKGTKFWNASFCEDYLEDDDPDSKWSEHVYFLVQKKP